MNNLISLCSLINDFCELTSCLAVVVDYGWKGSPSSVVLLVNEAGSVMALVVDSRASATCK